MIDRNASSMELTLYEEDSPPSADGADGKVRKKRHHKKVRTGCLTCRLRRVKCDEGKPTCHRCQIKKVDCKWPGSIGSSSGSASLACGLTKPELRGLQYFRERTAYDLSGAFDEDFWTDTLLRVSFSNSSLQHFLIAISSLDEAYKLRSMAAGAPSSDPRALFSFSLSQYNMAIHDLLQPVGRDTPTAASEPFLPLISSILCLVYETWMGEIGNAGRYASAARDLLLQLEQSQQDRDGGDEQTQLIAKYLRPLITRKCRSIGLLVPGSSLAEGHSFPEVDMSALSQPSTGSRPLRDYSHARNRFQALSSAVVSRIEYLMTSESGGRLMRHVMQLQACHDQWYEDLLDLDRRSFVRHLSEWSRERCLLEIRYRVHRISVLVVPFNNEMLYDEHFGDFLAITDTCEEFLKSTHRPFERRGSVCRTSDYTTNMPLTMVGTYCRDPHLRRRAIRLLYRYRRLECCWSSIMCGIYAEQMMMLEEEGLSHISSCADVPPANRAILVGALVDGGRDDEADEESADVDPSRPPTMTITYTRPASASTEIQAPCIVFRGYHVMSGFGVKSVAWWPDHPGADLFNSEVDEASKSYDGPFVGRSPLIVREKRDLESACNMQRLCMEMTTTTTTKTQSPTCT